MSADDHGITYLDRIKLTKELERARRASSESKGLPKPDSRLVTTIREYLEDYDAKTVFKSRDLADGVPYSPRQIGQALARLEREGVVAKESDGSGYGGVSNWTFP